MGKLLYAVLVGLVGAAIVHIATLFLLPHYKPRDAWSQLAHVSEPYQLTPVTGSGANVVPLVRNSDPLMRAGACRFDLANGGIHLFSPRTVPFWSLSIHDRAGQTTYSLTDRAATNGVLDIIVLSPLRMADMRRAMPPEFDGAIFIETATAQGIVVVRALMPDQSWTGAVDAFFAEMGCEPLPD